MQKSGIFNLMIMPKKTVGFCGTIATMLIWGGAVFAAGYTCPTYKKYTSCSSGYYLNGTNAGNSCTPCPSGCTCAGGTAAPSCTPKCPAGQYYTGSTCSNCGGPKWYCPGDNKWYTVSSGYYSTGGTLTTRTGQSQCTGTTYCSNGVKYNCPNGYNADTSAGKTSASQCKISILGGKYLGTANGTSVSECPTATYKEAHTVSYGGTSTCTACPDKYTGSDNGRTSIHDCYTYDTALVTCKPANAYSGTGWDYYDNNDNGGTGHDRCLYTVKKCNSGYYLTNNTCAQCPTDYPITDPRNNLYSDETSIEECWRDCGVSDIPHATAVSGWREYGGRNTCVATSCENGYYLNNRTCTQCTGATYCTNSIKYECPSEFDANTDPGKTAASQCQIMVNPGYAVERGAYTQTPCDPNYYCPGGLVAYGAHGVWSHCPKNYSSPRGSSKLSDCYKTCTQENENNGTLVPDDTTVYYPDDCTYKRVCNDGYAPTNNSCMALCRSGITQIRLGNTPTPIPLFDERQTTPTVVIRTPSGGLCYGNLSKGNGKTNTINLNIMGTTYHMPIE